MLPSYEGEKKAKKLTPKEQAKEDKRKIKSANTFADYEEFAHLLDGDSDEENGKKHVNAMGKNNKRTFEQRDTNFQKGGRQTYKSKNKRQRN